MSIRQSRKNVDIFIINFLKIKFNIEIVYPSCITLAIKPKYTLNAKIFLFDFVAVTEITFLVRDQQSQHEMKNYLLSFFYYTYISQVTVGTI